MSPVRRARLSTLVFSVVAVLVLALVSTGTATGIARMRNANAQEHLSDRLMPAQLATKDLTTAYLDLETAERGYLLTGDPSFLQPYEEGQARVVRLESQVHRLLADEGNAAESVAAVSAAGETWREGGAEPAIEARRTGAMRPDRVDAQEAASRVLFERLREQLEALEKRTQQLVDEHLAAITYRQTVANVVGAVAVGVALLAAALWVPVLRRVLVRPLQNLERQVQAVAAGAYEQTIRSNGPAEVDTIAGAVDSMRDSLVRSSQELVETQHQLTLRDERERMAADLHDLTIQRVFALGLALSSTAVRQPRLAPSLEPLIEETDAIIRELRGVIFGIRRDPEEGTLRHRVGEVVQDSARGLGFTPALEFFGPVDSACDDQLAGEVLAVLREALSNVARHAHASRSTIRVAVDGSRLMVSVSDDGMGLGDVQQAGHGLGNLRLRAVRLGGQVTVTSEPGAGTALTWEVPLAPVGAEAVERRNA